MDKNFNKIWLQALEARFGMSSEIREVSLEGRPSILVYYFADFPEKGMLTAVTSGLSNANHPAWQFGRPELSITLDTDDWRWGKAAGFFALAFYGDKAFSYGESFKLDFPIAEDSEMNAVFLYKPSFMTPEQAKFELPDRIVHIAGMYPMYEDEIAVYEAIGIEDFWASPNFDYYNPRRPHVTAVKA